MDAPENSVHAKTRAGWRQWLQKHHTRDSGLWVVTYKKASGKPRVEYAALVEEALCFGWIDSKVGKLDDERSMLWFAPRKAKTGWSKPNKERVARSMASKRWRCRLIYAKRWPHTKRQRRISMRFHARSSAALWNGSSSPKNRKRVPSVSTKPRGWRAKMCARISGASNAWPTAV
jgi:hypothetical protein